MECDIDASYAKIGEQAIFMNDTIDLFRNFFNPNKIKENIFLEDVVKNTLSITQDLLTDIKLIREIDKLDDKVFVFPNELIQVCINIIKNAKEFMEEKGIKPKVIKISVYEESDYHVISIHDNAGGIPDDIIDKVFDQYFTTKDEDKGTGIGLNLARQILEEKHDGKIKVENKTFIFNDITQTGACFQLYLKKS
jgi:signal transduction histidine kinase